MKIHLWRNVHHSTTDKLKSFFFFSNMAKKRALESFTPESSMFLCKCLLPLNNSVQCFVLYFSHSWLSLSYTQGRYTPLKCIWHSFFTSASARSINYSTGHIQYIQKHMEESQLFQESNVTYTQKQKQIIRHVISQDTGKDWREGGKCMIACLENKTELCMCTCQNT